MHISRFFTNHIMTVQWNDNKKQRPLLTKTAMQAHLPFIAKNGRYIFYAA